MDVNNLKIGTWNIKNSYFKLSQNKLKVNAIVELVEKESLDILFLQEVNPILAKQIKKKLKTSTTEYRINTKYHYHINPISNLRVEYNMVISKLETVTSSMKKDLPSMYKGSEVFKNIFSIRKRNIIGQVLKNSHETKNHVFVSNTHLEPKSAELRKRQLTTISDYLKLQDRLGFNIVVAGNLNSKPNDQEMIDFKIELSRMHLKVIENNHNTYIGHNDNMPVDYIIIPKNWDVESIKTLDNYQEVSSHMPIVAKVIRK